MEDPTKVSAVLVMTIIESIGGRFTTSAVIGRHSDGRHQQERACPNRR
jgi:hypothetical protein